MVLEKTVRLTNKLGLHVRPCAQIVDAISKYKAEVVILKDKEGANGKSIIELLSLGAGGNTVLTIKAEGEEAELALKAIQSLIDNKFGEE